MEDMFRPAEARDAEAVWALFRQAISHMREAGIEQWDEMYPTEALLRADIEKGEMYVLESGGEIFSAVVVNEHQDAEYAEGGWRCEGRAAVIHRLCVHPGHQHQGVAGETMRHAERLIAQRGYRCIRLDAFTLNPYALKLYGALGYRKAGEYTFRKGRFVLLEKALP